MKKVYLCSAAVVGLLCASAAHAQTAVPADAQAANAGIAEIIVTAEKRSQNSQNVPIAISALGQNQFDRIGGNSLESLRTTVPSVQFSTQAADAPRVQITIRGLGSDIIEAGADTGVGLYLDGVYLGGTAGALANVYDIERAEVLRGPQGTLYGRNTTGGAINVISRKPVFGTEAMADVAYGSYNAVTGRASVNTALSDKLAARITVVGERRDGFQKNLVPGGTRADDRRSFFVRSQLLFQPSETTSFLVSGFLNQIDGAGPATRTLGAKPFPYLVGILDSSFGPGTLAGVPNLSFGAFAPAKALPADYHQVYKDEAERLDLKLMGLTGTFSWDAGAVNFKSITSYQGVRQFQHKDGDNTELALSTRERREKGDQFSQEFNLSSKDGRTFTWLLGAFYYHDTTDPTFKLYTAPGIGIFGPGNGTTQLVSGHVKTSSIAGYAQGSFHASPALTFTAGGRFTSDRKEMTSSAGFADNITNTLLGAGGLAVRIPVTRKATFNRFTWKAGLEYKPAERVLVYGSVSTGFKSGGFNLGNPLSAGFGPETLTAYEVGLKSRFLDNHVQFNLAAFHYDVKNMQLQVFGLGGPELINAASAKVDGVEVDVTAQITRAFRLSGSLALLDTRYGKGFSLQDPTRLSFLPDPANPAYVPPFVNLSGNKLSRAPATSLSVQAEYTVPVGEGRVDLSTNYSYQSKVFFNAFNATDNFRFQPGYGLLGASITYHSPGDKWTLAVFGQNLTDKQFITNVFIPPILLGASTEATVGAPRTVGARLGVKF